MQLDLFAQAEETRMPTHVPGHRYQRIGTCQCRLRENDSVSGMWGSVDRVGVLARLAMSPVEHSEHIARLTIEAGTAAAR